MRAAYIYFYDYSKEYITQNYLIFFHFLLDDYPQFAQNYQRPSSMMNRYSFVPHRFEPPRRNQPIQNFHGLNPRPMSLLDMFMGLPQVTVSINAARRTKTSNSSNHENEDLTEFTTLKTTESNIIDIDGQGITKKDLNEEEDDKTILGVDRRRRNAQFYGIPLSEDIAYSSQVRDVLFNLQILFITMVN